MNLTGHDYVAILAIFATGIFCLPIYLNFFGYPYGLIIIIIIISICTVILLINRYRYNKNIKKRLESLNRAIRYDEAGLYFSSPMRNQIDSKLRNENVSQYLIKIPEKEERRKNNVSRKN